MRFASSLLSLADIAEFGNTMAACSRTGVDMEKMKPEIIDTIPTWPAICQFK
jgi:hypothetical protein